MGAGHNDLDKARTLLRELSSYLKGIEIPA